MAPAFHQTLNPRLWQGTELRPEVRVRLLRAALAFYQFLDLPGLRIEDIVLTGSNAAFTYADESDCDLHLIVDHANTRCPDMAAGYFDTKRLLWNQTHDANIRRHPVEVYVEDREQPAYSSGVYSILRGEWVKEPKRGAKPRLDDAAITRKVASLRSEISSLLASSDPQKSEVDGLLSRLSTMRRAGLAREGEFSVENIAYKLLRAEGLIDKLRQARVDAEDRDLSLNENRQIDEAIRPPVTYEQVVTPEWVTEVLDYGFDVGVAHPEATADYQGDHARYDHQSVVRMLHELQDDDVIPEDVDISDPHEARPYLEKWFKDRYAFVLRTIEVTQLGSGYVIHRAIAVPEMRARMMSGDNSPLGTFWSFSHGEVFWGDADQGELHMQAVVAANHIDWITTIRRNMNYVIGEDELEVFLPSGTPVKLVSMRHDGHDIEVLNPNRVA